MDERVEFGDGRRCKEEDDCTGVIQLWKKKEFVPKISFYPMSIVNGGLEKLNSSGNW